MGGEARTLRGGIRISSVGDGWRDEVKTSVRAQVCADEMTVFYTIDGDECVMKLAKDAITQTRRGNVNLTISFLACGQSECVVGEGGLTGAFPIVVNKFVCRVGSLGCRANLNYLNADGGCVELSVSVNLRRDDR